MRADLCSVCHPCCPWLHIICILLGYCCRTQLQNHHHHHRDVNFIFTSLYYHVYSSDKVTQRTWHIHIFSACVFMKFNLYVGITTVIYTSITILHWWFCATVKYSYGITGGGGMVSETQQCYAPIHSMRLCVLRRGNHMRSVRWNTTVCRPLYHGVPENSSTKKRWHTRCSLFCWANERMFIHGPNMPTCLSGRDTWLFWIWSVAGLFCFHIPFLQAMCSRSVYMDVWWHAALRQFRYQQGYCLILLFVTYTWHFCKWCRRIAHAGNFKPIPRRVKLEQKIPGSTTV